MAINKINFIVFKNITIIKKYVIKKIRIRINNKKKLNI